MEPQAPPLSFLATLKCYLDKRVWVIFVLGFASGFPWVLIGSAMSAWLKEAGLTRSAIGFFGSVFAVYAINFLWAPLLDRTRPPFLARFGQRKSWLLLMLAIMFVAVLLLSRTHPESTLWWTSALALVIAIASATQDVSIDAYLSAPMKHISSLSVQRWRPAAGGRVIACRVLLLFITRM